MIRYPILKITANQTFLPLVISFVEKYSESYSFSSKETKAITLATEEIFMYLCETSKDCTVEIVCKAKQYLIEVEWKFTNQNFDPRAFNITYKINPDDEASLSEMGLLLANRMTDIFTMQQSGTEIKINCARFRSYPDSLKSSYNPKAFGGLKIKIPEKQQVILLGKIIEQEDNQNQLPLFLTNPYLLSDMFEQKDIEAKILVDEKGLVAGGVLWKKSGKETCEMFGPFIHKHISRESFSEQLVESCLEQIAKENYTGLLCSTYPTYFPGNYFEEIGNYGKKKIFFRELQEDTGTISWINAKIADYLQKQYEQLFLLREVVTVPFHDSTTNQHSVISSEINRAGNSAKLLPLVYGADLEENISEHLAMFAAENFQELFFELDLGNNQNSLFVPALLKNGFKPSFVIPNGGKGDLLLLQHNMQNLNKDEL